MQQKLTEQEEWNKERKVQIRLTMFTSHTTITMHAVTTVCMSRDGESIAIYIRVAIVSDPPIPQR